jgi:hypothetical protein
MRPQREIRAEFDRATITVYQAYGDAIADPALAAGRLVAPFSFERMTWIKPSFCWLMARSAWGTRPGQTRVLAVHIGLAAWESALRTAVLTSFDPHVHGSPEAWQRAFEVAPVHVQWDPERSIAGTKLGWRSIQVGLSRAVVRRFAEGWIVGLDDLTPRVRKMRDLLRRGHAADARRHLPPERTWPAPPQIRHRLGMRD